MKKRVQSPLPKSFQRRDALNFGGLKVKPRLFLPVGFWRLKSIFKKAPFIGTLCLLLTLYFPNLNLGPATQPQVLASQTSISQVIAASLPQPIILPHPGYITTHFSSWHPGIDLATGLGMPIHPVTSGVVEEIDYGFIGYGNHVIVSHPNGFKSLYAHMGRVYVKKDQVVDQSSILGEVGVTGFTTGPHTHLEITYNSAYIDPLTILPEVSDYPAPTYIGVGGNNTLAQPTNLRKTLRPDL